MNPESKQKRIAFGYKRLSAVARLNGHYEHHIALVKIGVNGFNRSIGLYRYCRLFAAFFYNFKTLYLFFLLFTY